MATRVEQDRHFQCEPGLCKAPAPRKLASGRNQGRCVPRRTWWLRTVNSVGKRVSIAFKSEIEARTAAAKGRGGPSTRAGLQPSERGRAVGAQLL